MCGRFENMAKNEELRQEFEKYFGNLLIDYDLKESLKFENIAPTNTVRVITFDGEDNVFKLQTMKWGIKSSVFDPKLQAAGKDPMKEKDIFNSKIETIVKKGSKWKKFMKDTRCIFPMTAFYEWPVSMDKKPQRITIQRKKLFFAGGIYTEGIDKKTSASIVTCEVNAFMKPLHHRMPLLFKTDIAGEFLRANEEVAASMCIPLDNEIKMKLEKANI